MSDLNVHSEIAPLKKVMLHRPGEELLNLSPGQLGSVSFDDIPFLDVAQEEHDAFAQALIDEGVEVIYLVDILAEALDANPGSRERFFEEWLDEAAIDTMYLKDAVRSYMDSISDTREFIGKCISGLRRGELELKESIPTPLSDLMGEGGDSAKSIAVRPIPNTYFTRDPFSVVGSSVVLSSMRLVPRRRETLLAKYIFDLHPKYHDVDVLYGRDRSFSLEGGDIMVPSARTVLIGVSDRTQAAAIDMLARQLLLEDDEGAPKFDEVFVLSIPHTRAFMHLDTVLTQVDYGTFTVHPSIVDRMQAYRLTRAHAAEIAVQRLDTTLTELLAAVTKQDEIKLIKCGGDDPTAAAREQWSDGSNTLCIAPGKVCVYQRNTVTNELLEQNDIELVVIPSAELSRGRGGPRCMSMPFIRQDS